MKPTLLPDFEENVEYRQLHPTKEGKKRWRFVTRYGIRLPIKGITNRVIAFHDKTGKVWGRIDGFGIYIEEGYAWNGCSPKKWVWPFGWMGTPDFKSTILASLFHDFGYQFGACEHFPLHKSDVDAIFYHCIAMAGDSDIAGVYHGAVKKWGGPAWLRCGKDGEFSTILR